MALHFHPRSACPLFLFACNVFLQKITTLLANMYRHDFACTRQNYFTLKWPAIGREPLACGRCAIVTRRTCAVHKWQATACGSLRELDCVTDSAVRVSIPNHCHRYATTRRVDTRLVQYSNAVYAFMSSSPELIENSGYLTLHDFQVDSPGSTLAFDSSVFSHCKMTNSSHK